MIMIIMIIVIQLVIIEILLTKMMNIVIRPLSHRLPDGVGTRISPGRLESAVLVLRSVVHELTVRDDLKR